MKAEKTLTTALSNEYTRAYAYEELNTNSLKAVISRAIQTENDITNAVHIEVVSRAQSAEYAI